MTNQVGRAWTGRPTVVCLISNLGTSLSFGQLIFQVGFHGTRRTATLLALKRSVGGILHCEFLWNTKPCSLLEMLHRHARDPFPFQPYMIYAYMLSRVSLFFFSGNFDTPIYRQFKWENANLNHLAGYPAIKHLGSQNSPASVGSQDLLANYVAQMGEPSLVSLGDFLGQDDPLRPAMAFISGVYFCDPDDMALLRCHVIHSHRSHIGLRWNGFWSVSKLLSNNQSWIIDHGCHFPVAVASNY